MEDEKTVPAHEALLEDLKAVRRYGVGGIRRLEIPSLAAAASTRHPAVALEPGAIPNAVRALLNRALDDIGGTPQECAEILLGLTPGTSMWPLARRRSSAAAIWGNHPDTFRKRTEGAILSKIAEAILDLTYSGGMPSLGDQAATDDPSSLSETRREAVGTTPAPSITNTLSGTIGQAVQVGRVDRLVVHLAGTESVPSPAQIPRGREVLLCRDRAMTWISEQVASDRTLFVLYGIPGVGTSELATSLAHTLSRDAPDGQLYLDLRGRQYSQVEDEVASTALLHLLGVPDRLIQAEHSVRIALARTLLATHRYLLFIDNAQTASLLHQVRSPNGATRIIMAGTLASDDVQGLEDASVLHVDPLSSEDAYAFLETHMHLPLTDHQRLLALRCDGLPRRLRQLANHLQRGEASPPTLSMEDVLVSTLLEPTHEILMVALRLPYQPIDLRVLAQLAGVSRSGIEAICVDLEQNGLARIDRDEAVRWLVLELGYDQVLSGSQEMNELEITRIGNWYLRQVSDAVSKSLSSGVASRTTRAHIRATAKSSPGPGDTWLAREGSNILTVAEQLQEIGNHRLALEICLAYHPHLMHHFRFPQWAQVTQCAIAAASHLDDESKEDAYIARGYFHFRSSHYLEATGMFSATVAMADKSAHYRAQGTAKNGLGLVALRQRRLDDAQNAFSEARLLLVDPRWQIVLRSNLAEVALNRNDTDGALRLLRGVADELERLGRDPERGNALWLQAWAERLRGNTKSALALVDGAIAIAEHAQADIWRAHWYLERARILVADDKLEEALHQCDSAILLHQASGDLEREGVGHRVRGAILSRLLAATPESRELISAEFNRAELLADLVASPWDVALARVNLHILQQIDRADGDSFISELVNTVRLSTADVRELSSLLAMGLAVY